MTIEEAINEIRSTYKWYAIDVDDNKQKANCITARCILKGTAKQKRTREFFEKFGYEVVTTVRKIEK